MVFQVEIRFGFGFDIERLNAIGMDDEGESVNLNGFLILLPFIRILIADVENVDEE